MQVGQRERGFRLQGCRDEINHGGLRAGCSRQTSTAG